MRLLICVNKRDTFQLEAGIFASKFCDHLPDIRRNSPASDDAGLFLLVFIQLVGSASDVCHGTLHEYV